MGYYLPHKSYLRPRLKARRVQRLIIIATTSISLISAGIIFASLEFGSTKNVLADVTPETLIVKSVVSQLSVNHSLIVPDPSIPVELAFFTVDANGDRAEIKFATQTEYDNDYFTIEKSENGGIFTEFACIESAGGATLGSLYSITDMKPGTGMTFYRLRQTSDNGHSSYIGLEKVIMNTNETNLSLYIDHIGPQPFDKYFTIGYYSDREGGVAVEIFNKTGKKIYKSYTTASRGYNTCRFTQGADLIQNEYTVRIANSSGAYTKKIQKKI